MHQSESKNSHIVKINSNICCDELGEHTREGGENKLEPSKSINSGSSVQQQEDSNIGQTSCVQKKKMALPIEELRPNQ